MARTSSLATSRFRMENTGFDCTEKFSEAFLAGLLSWGHCISSDQRFSLTPEDGRAAILLMGTLSGVMSFESQKKLWQLLFEVPSRTDG